MGVILAFFNGLIENTKEIKMGWFQLVCSDLNGQDRIIRTYNFDNKEIVCIGRSSACDIQVDNAAVSREHAKIEIAVIEGNERYTLYNHKINNGTYVNREPVMEGKILKDRDRIAVCGQQTIIFRTGNIHAQSEEDNKPTYVYRG